MQIIRELAWGPAPSVEQHKHAKCHDLLKTSQRRAVTVQRLILKGSCLLAFGLRA